jgi:hypothetical protein
MLLKSIRVVLWKMALLSQNSPIVQLGSFELRKIEEGIDHVFRRSSASIVGRDSLKSLVQQALSKDAFRR